VPLPQPLDLAACRRLALDKQPALAAARASLAAAAARSEALDHLHLPGFLARDLPIRRQQAALGITIAEAGVTRAEGEALYGVTYCYLSALYARQQQTVADQALKNLQELHDLANQIVSTASRTDVSKREVDQIGVYILVARGRRAEAVEGEQRALAGLREALSLGADCPLSLAASTLPMVTPAVDRAQVLALALARRGELAQASNAAQVFQYEVEAQQHKRLLPRASTFASGSDIHAQPVPPGSYDEVYKPGAVGVEMPTTLVGSRGDRVEQAEAYNARAAAVVDKTQGLVTLDAESAYLRWVEASEKVRQYRKAADEAEQWYKSLRDAFNPRVTDPKVTIDKLLNAGILSSQLRVQANQAHYQQLLALAALERATAGGFCAGFEAQSPAAPEPLRAPK
jgi:outer membrane protein TolC